MSIDYWSPLEEGKVIGDHILSYSRYCPEIGWPFLGPKQQTETGCALLPFHRHCLSWSSLPKMDDTDHALCPHPVPLPYTLLSHDQMVHLPCSDNTVRKTSPRETHKLISPWCDSSDRGACHLGWEDAPGHSTATKFAHCDLHHSDEMALSGIRQLESKPTHRQETLIVAFGLKPAYIGLVP